MSLTDTEMLKIRETLEKLEKSFNAMGYPNANQGGKTGLAALARISMDPVLHSIAASDKNFRLTKDIKKDKAISSVHTYKVETSVASAGLDLAGTENFLPQEDQGQFETVSEALKVYGIKKTLGDMAQLVNEAGGFEIDIEKQNEIQAIKALTQQYERDFYAGADFYLNPATSLIDPNVANMFYGRSAVPAVRHVRGIQNNIREGNISSRGISGDFLAYGNSFTTLIDLAGQAMDQEAVDDIANAILSNGQGVPAEAHCQPAQATEFRKTLLGFQRGDIGSKFAIQGPDVRADDAGFVVGSVAGDIKFIPCIYKHAVRQKALPVNGSAGAAPAAPTIAAQASAAISGVTSPFTAGQTTRCVVQSASIKGMSAGTGATLTCTNAGECLKVRITHVSGADHYWIFLNPAGSTTVGLEGFVGKVLVPAGTAVGGTFDVVLSGETLPGFEPVVFLPSADEERVRMAALGNMINKIELGRQGLAAETVFSSYFCLTMAKPRAFGMLTNPKARLRTLR
jgi:hypothetical protein